MHFLTSTMLFLVLGNVSPEIAQLQKVVEEPRRYLNSYIEITGWVVVEFESYRICKEKAAPIEGCLRLNIADFPRNILKQCTEIVRWADDYHGNEVTVTGLLVGGNVGHMGMPGVALSLPEVRLVKSAKQAQRGDVGNCDDVLRRFGTASNFPLQPTGFAGG